MGLFDRLMGKKTQSADKSVQKTESEVKPNVEPQSHVIKPEDELRSIIAQVRDIPGADIVFKMADLINLEDGSLIPDANIMERPGKEGEKVISIVNPRSDTMTRRLRVTIDGKQIQVQGGVDNKETQIADVIMKKFDRQSKVEISSIRQKADKRAGKMLSQIEAKRDPKNIEKVNCTVYNRGQTFERVIDASYADADISTLDAVDEINFGTLDPNAKDSVWTLVRRKIEKSENYKGLCEHIKRNSLETDKIEDPVDILDYESNRRKGKYWLSEKVAEYVDVPPSEIINAVGDAFAFTVKRDELGNRINKTSEEEEADRKMAEQRAARQAEKTKKREESSFVL